VDTLEVLKQRIVAYALINTADEDYVTARWAFLNNISQNFFWHSAVSIEKYLKSGLLLNHRSAKSEGHDICTLFDRVLEPNPKRPVIFPQVMIPFVFKTEWSCQWLGPKPLAETMAGEAAGTQAI
jgi:HEPN domain-containing protein